MLSSLTDSCCSRARCVAALTALQFAAAALLASFSTFCCRFRRSRGASLRPVILLGCKNAKYSSAIFAFCKEMILYKGGKYLMAQNCTYSNQLHGLLNQYMATFSVNKFRTGKILGCLRDSLRALRVLSPSPSPPPLFQKLNRILDGQAARYRRNLYLRLTWSWNETALQIEGRAKTLEIGNCLKHHPFEWRVHFSEISGRRTLSLSFSISPTAFRDILYKIVYFSVEPQVAWISHLFLRWEKRLWRNRGSKLFQPLTQILFVYLVINWLTQLNSAFLCYLSYVIKVGLFYFHFAFARWLGSQSSASQSISLAT